MGMFNYLNVAFDCPNCGRHSENQAEFRFGLLNLDTYSIGDKLSWDDCGKGLKSPETRPESGNYLGEGYIECPFCNYDFWLTITVAGDMIESAKIDHTRQGYVTLAKNKEHQE